MLKVCCRARTAQQSAAMDVRRGRCAHNASAQSAARVERTCSSLDDVDCSPRPNVSSTLYVDARSSVIFQYVVIYCLMFYYLAWDTRATLHYKSSLLSADSKLLRLFRLTSVKTTSLQIFLGLSDLLSSIHLPVYTACFPVVYSQDVMREPSQSSSIKAVRRIFMFYRHAFDIDTQNIIVQTAKRRCVKNISTFVVLMCWCIVCPRRPRNYENPLVVPRDSLYSSNFQDQRVKGQGHSVMHHVSTKTVLVSWVQAWWKLSQYGAQRVTYVQGR